jgi:adenylate kinase
VPGRGITCERLDHIARDEPRLREWRVAFCPLCTGQTKWALAGLRPANVLCWHSSTRRLGVQELRPRPNVAFDKVGQLRHNSRRYATPSTLARCFPFEDLDIMRVVCTGQSGLNKPQFLRGVQQFARQQGKDVEMYDVGRLLCEEAEVQPDAILNLRLPHLECLRRRVHRLILDDLTRSDADHAILCTHAAFRWQFGLFLAISPEDLVQFEPDVFITLIDDVDAIKVELDRRCEQHPERPSLTLLDILYWREEEIDITQLCARFLSSAAHRVDSFIVPKMHQVKAHDGTLEVLEENTQLFYRLMLERDVRKRVYISFPVSQVMQDKEVWDEIKGYRASLREDFIVTDPLDIGEGGLRTYYNSAQQLRTIQDGQFAYEVRGNQLRVREDEVRLAMDVIEEQINARDYRLVDQNELVFAFLPLLKSGMPAGSWGVNAELTHAHDTGKQTFIVCENPASLGPFKKMATRFFSSVEEAVATFRKLGWIPEEGEGGNG